MSQDCLTCFLMERLREVRIASCLPIETVALRMGASSRKIMQWENSPKPDITLAQVADYALVCGCIPVFNKGSIVNE